MGNQGWTSGGGGGEAVSSTERATGVTTQCADGEPFLVGSGIASPGPNPGDLGERGDLFEPPGQLSGEG
jgi:hypothetical protein